MLVFNTMNFYLHGSGNKKLIIKNILPHYISNTTDIDLHPTPVKSNTF